MWYCFRCIFPSYWHGNKWLILLKLKPYKKRMSWWCYKYLKQTVTNELRSNYLRICNGIRFFHHFTSTQNEHLRGEIKNLFFFPSKYKWEWNFVEKLFFLTFFEVYSWNGVEEGDTVKQYIVYFYEMMRTMDEPI